MKNKTKNQCGRKGERIFSNVCVLPSLLGVMIFFLVPFCIVIYYSLINNPVLKEFVGLENYTKLFSNSAFTKAAKNTAFFSLVSVPLSVVLSLGLAMLLERNIPGKSIFRTFFLSPLMVPTASVVLVWQVLFHNHGTVNQIVEAMGGHSIDWIKSSHGQLVIICMFLWKNLGYNMILFMSALCAIPKDIIEEVRFDCVEDYRRFLPDGLPEEFTSAHYAKACKINKQLASNGLNILNYLGLVERVGKKGNSFIYKVVEK